MYTEGDKVDPSKPVVNERGFSLLTDNGIAYIEKTKRIRLDVSGRVLFKKSVGLADDAMAEIVVGTPGAPKVAVELVAPYGVEEFSTDTFFTGGMSAADAIGYVGFYESFRTVDEMCARLRYGVEHWGFKRENVEQWIAEVNQPSARNEKRKWVVSEGVSPTGLVAAVTSTAKNGIGILQYEIYLDPETNSEASLKNIREKGRSL